MRLLDGWKEAGRTRLRKKAATARKTGSLARIEELTLANRERRDAALERQLVRLRHEAFAEVAAASSRPLAAPAGRALPHVGGIPVVEPAQLSADVVRAGILDAGCVLVRGLLPRAQTQPLVEGIERALDARAVHREGDEAAEAAAWYAPLKLGGGAYNLERQRRWVSQASGVWTADSPRMTFELVELFDSVGLTRLIADYLGARPVASVNKWTLRRVSPGGDADWHQDGAFLGESIPALNVWLALSPCGRDAPGLDIVPQRLERVVETGTEGARFAWSTSPATVESILDGQQPARPTFEPGDALLFDQLMLHQTATSADMSRDRFAVETWCFTAGDYPERQVPLVI